tara:strand:- start:111 stop:443 length:333 start_codon:yes stop_codon:yes gene_type:complete
LDNRICIPSSPEYKDYTLEIVQKLLEPPNGFDATTTNNKCRFLLCIVLHTVCLYHLGSLCCVHTVVFNKFFFYHHFFVVVPWKKNEYCAILDTHHFGIMHQHVIDAGWLD